MHRFIKVVLALFLVAMMPDTHAASFNCSPSNLKRDIERFICNNKTISELDAVMGNRFDAAYQQLSPVHKVDYLKSQNSVSRIEINGKQCGFDREQNPYRPGGASVADSVLKQRLDRNNNVIKIYM